MTSECKALSVSADVFPIYAMIEKQQLKVVEANIIMLRFCLLTCALLITVATTNKSVCIAGAASPGAEQVSSECLSCHEDIEGQDGSSHSGSHAVGVVYADHAARDESLRPLLALPSELLLFEGVVTCATCHGSDPHDGQVLAISNRESALCQACHLK
jgi:hypothetical protein